MGVQSDNQFFCHSWKRKSLFPQKLNKCKLSGLTYKEAKYVCAGTQELLFSSLPISW